MDLGLIGTKQKQDPRQQQPQQHQQKADTRQGRDLFRARTTSDDALSLQRNIDWIVGSPFEEEAIRVVAEDPQDGRFRTWGAGIETDVYLVAAARRQREGRIGSENPSMENSPGSAPTTTTELTLRPPPTPVRLMPPTDFCGSALMPPPLPFEMVKVCDALLKTSTPP